MPRFQSNAQRYLADCLEMGDTWCPCCNRDGQLRASETRIVCLDCGSTATVLPDGQYLVAVWEDATREMCENSGKE